MARGLSESWGVRPEINRLSLQNICTNCVYVFLIFNKMGSRRWRRSMKARSIWEILRNASEALRKFLSAFLPISPRFFEETEKIRGEVTTVAALLLGDPRPR